MSLIDQQKDLESFSDQSLLQEAMQPMQGYPPFLVVAEIQRRQQDRQRVQQQAMAQQPKAPPVAEQQAAAFASQMQQGQPQAAPPGIAGAMPPEMGMGMGQPQAAQAPPPEAAGIMGGMPVQGMAGGGEIKRMQAGGSPAFSMQNWSERSNPGVDALNARILSSIRPRRSGSSLMREIAELEAAGRDASALRAELAAIQRSAAPEIGSGPVATPSSAPGIASIPAVSAAAVAAPEMGGVGRPQNPRRSFPDGVPLGRETKTESVTPSTAGLSLPVPRGSDFMSTYRGIVAEMTPLEEATTRARRFDPGRVRPDGTIASDPFFVEEAKRLESFRPNKERFERMSQADVLSGLGAVIGSATQRGDIARGLAQLTQQQREAQKEFRREEREFAGFESNLRREERAERMANERMAEDRRMRERQEGRETSRDALALATQVENNRIQQNQLIANIQNLNRELQVAQARAQTESMTAELKLVISRIEAQLKQSQIALNIARTKGVELQNAAGVGGFAGGRPFTPASEIVDNN